MDPIINSVTQSPFVKSLARIPAKAESFTYGMRDNVPPFSMQKVVVKPWNNPSKTTQKSTHKFKIPQYGTLNRAYLRIRTKNEELHNDNLRIQVSDYDDLFDIDSNVIPLDTHYKTFQSKYRIPWIHPHQLTSVIRKAKPFGGGGLAVLHNGTVRDPDSATLSIAQGDGHYASNIAVSDPGAMEGNASNGWNVINILENITLSAGGKVIENLYPETIPSEVLKMPPQMCDFYIRGMVGWSAGDDAGKLLSERIYDQPWDPSACYRDVYGRQMPDTLLDGDRIHEARNQHADFIVPLTLSSLKSLPKNYQTRFSEQMELTVDTKELGRGFNTLTAPTDKTNYHEVELVLIYHNWHSSVEAQLREANYKMKIPAQVYGTNWYKEPGPFKVVSDTETLSIPLTCRNLATEIVIVAKSLDAGSAMVKDTLKTLKSDYTTALEGAFTYNLEFRGSSKSLWKGTNVELQGPDSSDYELSGRRMRGGDCGYGGSKTWRNGVSTLETNGDNWQDRKISSAQYFSGGVDFSFSDNMSILKFGMQTTDEFYSGGIALQTIANPTLLITPFSGRLSDGKWLNHKIEFEVYVKYANMIEIDGDTGAIRATMNV